MRWMQLDSREWRLVVPDSHRSHKAQIQWGLTIQRRGRSKRLWLKDKGQRVGSNYWAWFFAEDESTGNVQHHYTFKSLEKAMRAMEVMARLDQ